MDEVNIHIARDAMEAHLLRGLLEAEGILAVVKGESLAAARGSLPLTQETLPSVWVRPVDAARAKEIARGLNAPPAARERAPAWRCPNCGETIEGQFTNCWKCGEAKPGE